MRLRSRHRNLVVMSTRAVPAYLPPARESTWPARTRTRRRFRLLRIGALLAVIAVMRLFRTMQASWRLSVGLSGVLLEIIGITLFSGPAQSAADLAGMVVILFALLRNTGPASGRRTGIPQAAWRWPG